MISFTALAATVVDLAHQARKHITRRLAPAIVARRNGPTVTAALDAGQLVTISTHLTTLGADDDTVRRYGPTLGKRVKAAHRSATGREPMRVWIVGPHGYPIEVCVYSPADPALTGEVAAYTRTAHLATV